MVPAAPVSRAVSSSWKTTTTPSRVQPHVGLDRVGAERRRAVEGGERVLRREGAPAAVRDEPGGGEGEEGVHGLGRGTSTNTTTTGMTNTTTTGMDDYDDD